ncbi:MAG: GldG family protein, partial [Nitrospirota bacterium]
MAMTWLQDGRLARWFGLLGLMLAVAGLAVYALWPRQSLAASLLEGAAVLCLITFLAVNYRAIRAVSAGRAARLGLHSGLMVIVFVAIVTLVNVLAARHSLQWDLSESGQFSLAPQTVQLLTQLSQDVKATLFVQNTGPDQGRTKRVLQGLMEGYQRHTPHLTVEYVDPDSRPAVAKQYGITQYNTVVFESGAQEARVRFSSPEELDNREQLFTNALIRVTRAEKKRIVFLEGHGEHRLDDAGQNGFSALKEALEREGFDVGSLLLAQQGSVPAGTTVLVVGGPNKLMAPQEVERLRAYLQEGGRLLVMVDPMTESGLEPLLGEWGVTIDQDLVIETSVQLFGAGAEVVVATSYSPTHPVTRDFKLSTAFPAARSLRADPARQGTLRYEGLVMTSEKSWGETDLRNPQVSLDRLRDLKGPLHLAAAVQPASPQEGEPAASETPLKGQLLVFGDSDFAANGFF